MAYEAKYWECGDLDIEDLEDAVRELIDQHVALALEDHLERVLDGALIDGNGIYLVDTDREYPGRHCSIKEQVAYSIECYRRENGGDESTIQLLKDARALLLECVRMIEEVL